MHSDPHCQTASIAVRVPAIQAFEYMSDGQRQGEWTLGSWNRRHILNTPAGDVFAGESLVDGSTLYVRPRGHVDSLLVDYDVGPSPDSLVHLISARIIPGPNLGRSENECVITLMSWRGQTDSDEAWTLDSHLFNAEMLIIRNRLEGSFRTE
ncbi:hypothetical protein [Elongatibacter sediminis]|uniref:Polyketide cyclase n=1 Tax=Elongatibacter sediminis TaxID=3119006 RepID=A0AAW9R7E9_9GAMM